MSPAPAPEADQGWSYATLTPEQRAVEDAARARLTNVQRSVVVAFDVPVSAIFPELAEETEPPGPGWATKVGRPGVDQHDVEVRTERGALWIRSKAPGHRWSQWRRMDDVEVPAPTGCYCGEPTPCTPPPDVEFPDRGGDYVVSSSRSRASEVLVQFNLAHHSKIQGKVTTTPDPPDPWADPAVIAHHKRVHAAVRGSWGTDTSMGDISADGFERALAWTREHSPFVPITTPAEAVAVLTALGATVRTCDEVECDPSASAVAVVDALVKGNL